MLMDHPHPPLLTSKAALPAGGVRRAAAGGRPTDSDAGLKPATQVATAWRNRASGGGGLCVTARGTKEQKPPFSSLNGSVPWGLFKSI